MRVSEYATIERYSHVMHIVSNVQARLRAGLDWLDLLRATFPAGTLSGAPKVRAMEIIDELETLRRGPYGGCVGYIDYSGNMDTAIAIRTLLVKDGEIFLRAGAGIVADSDPEARVPGDREQGPRADRGDRHGARGSRLASALMRVAMIDNYDSFTYNLVQYLAELGAQVEVVRNDAISAAELLDRESGGRRDLARARAIPTPRASRSTPCARAPSAARRCSASASGTSRSARRSAGRSCARAGSCTARSRRSSTTGRACSRGSHRRSRRRATTRS